MLESKPSTTLYLFNNSKGVVEDRVGPLSELDNSFVFQMISNTDNKIVEHPTSKKLRALVTQIPNHDRSWVVISDHLDHSRDNLSVLSNLTEGLSLENLDHSYLTLLTRLHLYQQVGDDWLKGFMPEVLPSLFFQWALWQEGGGVQEHPTWVVPPNSELEEVERLGQLAEGDKPIPRQLSELFQVLLRLYDKLEGERKRQKYWLEVSLWFDLNPQLVLPQFHKHRIEKYPESICPECPASTLIAIDQVIRWHNWRLGAQYVEQVCQWSENLVSSNFWVKVSSQCQQLGELAFNFLRTTNLTVSVVLFETVFLLLRKAAVANKSTYRILSQASYYLGLIELNQGNYARAADYFQICFSHPEPQKITNLIQLTTSASYQAANENFIALKVATQNFLPKAGKSFAINCFKFLNRTLEHLEDESPLLSKIKQLVSQTHFIIETEGLLPNHICSLDETRLVEATSQEVRRIAQEHMNAFRTGPRIKWLSVINEAGITLFEYDFVIQSSSLNKKTIQSGFIHAVSMWGEVELESGPAQELTFMGHSVIIEQVGNLKFIGLVTESTTDLRSMVRRFGETFGQTFQSQIINWRGENNVFAEEAEALALEILSQYFNEN